VRRTSFIAGGGHGWSISALETPRAEPAPWKIVVITGAPSWAEYWAETLAELPQDREMIVVDRPGYAGSEPRTPSPTSASRPRRWPRCCRPRRGQKVLLVGQSYGAAIASIMADKNPGKVAGLVLLSGFFGEAGPTAKWLLELGTKALGMIPRDLRHAVIEVNGQKPQLRHAKHALARLNIPIHMIHGDQDDFAPLEVAERLAGETITRSPIRVVRTAGANHFLKRRPGRDPAGRHRELHPATPVALDLPLAETSGAVERQSAAPRVCLGQEHAGRDRERDHHQPRRQPGHLQEHERRDHQRPVRRLAHGDHQHRVPQRRRQHAHHRSRRRPPATPRAQPSASAGPRTAARR
jgi:pimeloyl-ACP methyl ester carboxylesterase